MLEKFEEDCNPWEGPHTEVEEKREDEGESGKMCDELTATPVPLHFSGEEEEVGESGVKLILGRRG